MCQVWRMLPQNSWVSWTVWRSAHRRKYVHTSPCSAGNSSPATRPSPSSPVGPPPGASIARRPSGPFDVAAEDEPARVAGDQHPTDAAALSGGLRWTPPVTPSER